MKVVIYALGGLATGLAGVFQFATLGGVGTPTTASGLELQVIAAVVIGGGSLSGGEGTVLGTLIGCLIMSVLHNGCVHAGIPNAIQDIVIGIIIIVAVTLDRLRRGSGHLSADDARRVCRLRPAPKLRLTLGGCPTTMPAVLNRVFRPQAWSTGGI